MVTFATALGVRMRTLANKMFVAVAPRRMTAHHLSIPAYGVLSTTEAAARTFGVSLSSIVEEGLYVISRVHERTATAVVLATTLPAALPLPLAFGSATHFD